MSTVYEIITDRIVGLLEAGTVPWRRPWAGGEQFAPRNGQSGHKYRGINVFMLACQGYESPAWLTYRQVDELGGHVRKGEKSSPVVFWKWLEKRAKADADELDAASDGKPGVRRFPMLRYFRVFNAQQCDELPDRFDVPELPSYPVKPIASADRIVAGMPNRPDIQHGEPRAYYDRLGDHVNMPARERFEYQTEYYSVLFHELTHATGHDSRLNRRFGGRFGDGDYSREELVAEMGAAFLSAHAGIERNTLDNSAAYCQSWIRALRGDSKLAVIAAAQAQKAADYILNVQVAAERQVA